ncbi:hypothetical protein TNCV_2890271 [Trichonephila clavipes]|nr:hypothetical protein TNCV_2890271 [Trichonephila clavipes]
MISFTTDYFKASTGKDIYNEEIVQQVSHTQIAFECFRLVKVDISCKKKRNAYQHVADFDNGRFVVYQDCSLSLRSIAAHGFRIAAGLRIFLRNTVMNLKSPLK